MLTSKDLQVDFALREVVLEQTEKLDGVRTMDQVWNYLIGEAGAERKDAGLMAKLFQEQWYNGAQIGSSASCTEVTTGLAELDWRCNRRFTRLTAATPTPSQTLQRLDTCWIITSLLEEFSWCKGACDSVLMRAGC